MLTRVSNHSNSLLFCSSRPGRPPKRAPVGLSLAASHLQHQQLKKHRMDNGDYPYENGHMGGEYLVIKFLSDATTEIKNARVIKIRKKIE